MYINWKLIFTFCLLFSFVLQGQVRLNPLKVSLVQLIANPEKFDNRPVRVRGFMSMDREGDLLYLDQANAENVLSNNAIWVRRTEQMERERTKLNMRYVTIVGIFRANFKEQWGDPVGGISDVESAVFWSDPSHPMQQRIKEIPGVNSNP